MQIDQILGGDRSDGGGEEQFDMPSSAAEPCARSRSDQLKQGQRTGEDQDRPAVTDKRVGAVDVGRGAVAAERFTQGDADPWREGADTHAACGEQPQPIGTG